MAKKATTKVATVKKSTNKGGGIPKQKAKTVVKAKKTSTKK